MLPVHFELEAQNCGHQICWFSDPIIFYQMTIWSLKKDIYDMREQIKAASTLADFTEFSAAESAIYFRIDQSE